MRSKGASATTRQTSKGDSTAGGMVSKDDRVTMYQGIENTLNEQISTLQKQPGNEAAIKDLQKQKVANAQRADALLHEKVEPPSVIKGEEKIRRGLVRLFNAPEYEAAFPSQQRQMRTDAYDKYIAPFYKRAGKTPPDRDYFVDRIAPSTEQPLWEAISGGAVSAAQSTTKMARSLWLGTYASVDKMYHGGIGIGSVDRAKESDVYKTLTDVINKEELYLGEHYAEDTRSQVIKGIGKEAPGFIGWALAAEAAPLAGFTKLGNVYSQFALRRLNDFASGFLMSKLEEHDNKEAAETGGIAAGLGTAFDLFGKMVGWLGAKGAQQQIIKDANKLLQSRSAGPIITPPPSEVIPGTPELGGLPARKQLGPAESIQAPRSSIESQLPQRQLRSGVEGAKKPLDFLSQANFRILNQAAREVSGNKYKAFAMAPDAVRMEALKKVGYIMGNAINDVASANPEFIANTAKANIAQQAAKSPQFKQVMEVAAKATGKDPSIVVAQHVKEMTDQEKIWSRVKDLMKGLGPGAASKNEAAVISGVKDLVRSNLNLQGHANQITFAWSVKEALPEDVRSIVAQEMKNIYGPKPKLWDQAASHLEKHIDKMIKAGHIKPTDMRGVFRSTNLTGSPTEWQRQLTLEVKELTEKMRKSGKKFGPGAANLNDPSFKGEQELNDKMRQEVAKSSAGDTSKLQQATEKLFPGRKFGDLSGAERIQAVNESLKGR